MCLGLRCKAFQAPENSKLVISSDYSDEYREDLESYDVGTSVEIICDEDAKLEGEAMLTCEETGEDFVNLRSSFLLVCFFFYQGIGIMIYQNA